MNHSLEYVEPQFFTFGEPPEELRTESGRTIGPVTIAYETYGHLNADKSNAILICHALSGDAHAAGYHGTDQKPGWWNAMIGPGKAFDTDRYFVISSNVLGGCKGSTGPSSVDPRRGRPYALDFPMITIADMVTAQRHLVDHLGIDRLFSVAGGSMGGMQTLQWASAFPERLRSAIPIATTLKQSPQQIAFDEVIRQSVMADPAWNKGDYYGGEPPRKGLALARMIGHITFMSETSMESKFSRTLRNGTYSFSFGEDFEVEGYLRYRGDSFVDRFDANSYLYITRAMDYFDLSQGFASEACRESNVLFLVISFTSDWLYPPHQSREIARLLKRRGMTVTYCDLKSTYGHDAFLVEVDEQTRLIGNFLKNVERTVSLKPAAAQTPVPCRKPPVAAPGGPTRA